MASLFQKWLLVAAPPSLCTSSHNAMQCTSPNSLQYFWNTMHTQWKGACLLVLGHSWGPQKCSLGWSCAQNHKVEENSQALHCNTSGRVIILELNISPSPFCTLYMLHRECVPLGIQSGCVECCSPPHREVDCCSNPHREEAQWIEKQCNRCRAMQCWKRSIAVSFACAVTLRINGTASDVVQCVVCRDSSPPPSSWLQCAISKCAVFSIGDSSPPSSVR